MLARVISPGSCWAYRVSEVHWSDIHDWGFEETEVQDFLTIERGALRRDYTNPPHADPAGFIRQAKTLADKVIMFCSPCMSSTTSAGRTFANDGEYPLKAIYAFTQSIRWVGWKGSLWGKLKYGWFVFERGYNGPTIRKSITFDGDGEMKVE